MPPAVGYAIAGLAGLAGTAVASHAQSKAADKSLSATTTANNAAIVEQQKQDAEQKRQFEVAQAASKAQWDAEQGLKAPYRAAGRQALSSVGDLLGVNFNTGDYGAPSAPAASSQPTGDVPAAPKDLSAALAQANQIAYGGKDKHTDQSYWTKLWNEDPEYAWKRMLGWQAGGADAPTSGPYAGQSAASAMRARPVALAPTMPLNAPYSPTIPISRLTQVA